MSTDRLSEARCQTCGGLLPANTAKPICPRCALGGALNAVASGLTEEWHDVQAANNAQPPDGLPAAPSTNAIAVAAPPEEPGTLIGRYQLLEKIGEGGFGVVYVAEQREPVRRRVALKIIKQGMDTRQVVARFEAERQALAVMDHPNIAKVLDAGATKTGRPFFVMELVKGIPMTQYCEKERIETAEKLNLFIQVCHAIQHAHQKGIIHRDIKPSNILVTLHDGAPVPKVIDFGIAKATQQELTEKTVYTQFQQYIGTPAYMSPEQAEMSGLDIDTRTDIYSLGVLLYELLTGGTPFDTQVLLKSGLDEMRRIIREQEPARPSTRLRMTTNLQVPHSPLSLLHAQVSDDLDWIVMKCLEKDRRRRYETANGLAQDIERHLHHEPVQARPASTAYRIVKFIRRNRLAVRAMTAVGAALVVGLGLSTWLFFKEQEARDRAFSAEQEQRRLREEAEANVYAADMNLAQHALDLKDVGMAWSLLNRHRPAGPIQDANAKKDLRHWEWRYLWQSCQSDELLTLFHEPTWVEMVQFSPDGKLLAVRKGDGRIALWDWAGRQRLTEVPATPLTRDNPFLHNLIMVRDFALLPFDGLLAVASTSPDRRAEVVLWDANTGAVRDRFPHPSAILLLSSSPDGKCLAIWDDQQLVTVVDVQSKQACALLPVSPRIRSFPIALQFSPDGERLVIGDYDGRIRIVQWRTRVEVEIRPPPLAHGLTCVAWSPAESLLASSGGMENRMEGKVIRLWNPLTGESSGELLGHTDWISALAFTPDGQFLASASADRTVRLWRVADRSEVRRFKGHMDEVWAVAFTPDGKILASGDKAGTVRFWDPLSTNSNPSHLMLPDLANALAFTPDGQSLVTAGRDGRVRLWHPHAGCAGEDLPLFGTNAYGLDLSADGRWLAVGDRTGMVKIWDWPSRRALANLATPPVVRGELLFSAHRRFLLSRLELPHSTQVERLWETSTWGEQRLPPSTDLNLVDSFAVSPREDTYAAGYLDGTIKLWSLPTLELLAIFKEHTFTVRGLAFAPQGDLLASAGGDGFVNLWSLPSQRHVSKFRGHPNYVSGPAFSSDGRRLAMATYGIRLWDVTTLRELITLQPEGSGSRRVFFSPDGNSLATLASSGMVELWSAPSFEGIEAAERTWENSP